MDIFEHPGNLGAVRGSLLTILHADWPAYPQGNDFYTPLLQMTALPPGTEFVVVDNIDESFLLVADVQGKKLRDPYNNGHFHIAIWYEDLRELLIRGMAVGVQKNFIFMDQNIPVPSFNEYCDEAKASIAEADFLDDNRIIMDYVILSGNRLRITDDGRTALLARLRKEGSEWRDRIGGRVAHLFDLHYYDTAIREACIELEYDIKKYLSSNLYGDKLTEAFVQKLRAENKLLESYLRTFRQELRTVFKFIRNDFMHNLRDADEAAAYAMLFRIARTRSRLQAACT